MRTTDLHHAEARTDAGAGGTTPRRLIPSRFQPPAPAAEAEGWTNSVVRVTALLAVTAAAGVGLSLGLDRLFE